MTVLTLGLHEDDATDEPDGQPDRDVDEHDPSPRDQLSEQPTGHQPGGAAGSRHRGVEANGTNPLGSLGKARREEGEGARRSQRGTDALYGAGTEERPPAHSQATDERAQREDGDAEQEHPTAPEEVTRPCAEEQEPSKGEDVGVDDPRECAAREAQTPLDVRKRDIHDGGIEHHHQLGGEDHRQQDRSATRNRRRGVRTWGNVRRRPGLGGTGARRDKGGLGH